MPADFNRRAELRDDPERLRTLLRAPESRVLLWHRDKILVGSDGPLFRPGHLAALEGRLPPALYLGEYQQRAYFACQVSEWLPEFEQLQAVDLRGARNIADEFQLSLLFYSQALLQWHHHHRFCAKCGGETRVVMSGHARQCKSAACERLHFPKIEPAVIFAIVNHSGPQPKILLARQAKWDNGRFSVVAGFVEAGESLEQAIAREAREEVGLAVHNPQYFGSQPWPFPSSLMLGFFCETREWAIELFDRELEVARWLSAAELEAELLSGELKMPYSVSIAWRIIDHWFTGQRGYSVRALLAGTAAAPRA